MKKKFWFKISIVFLLVSGVHLLVPFFFAGGKTDPFYMRFTSHQQHSLILGTSRAAQGLHPDSFNGVLDKFELEGPVYNFSFTVVHSSYGPVYLSAIKKKLSSATKKGLFILSVDPYSVSTRIGNVNDDVSQFSENKLCLANMNFFNWNVNYEYLIKNYPHYWGELFISNFRGSGEVLANGRFQITASKNEKEIEERIKNNIINNNKEDYTFSKIRFEYLKKTIDFLLTKGDVVLVRLPVAKQMREVENTIMPDFDLKMGELVSRKAVPYFSYIDSLDQYTTKDGDHLFSESGKRLSDDLNDRIIVVLEKLNNKSL